MAAKNTARTPATTARRSVTKTEGKAPAKDASSPVKKQIDDAMQRARQSVGNTMLAGLGLIARVRKGSDERMAELVEEGKRVQPNVDKAIEDLKTKLRPEFTRKIQWDRYKPDLAKLKVDTDRFSRKAIEESIESRMAESLHRIGVPTRKEVQALARKVDKLAAAQAA